MMLQNAVSRLSSRREVVVMGVVKLLRPLSTQPVAEQNSAQLYRTSVNTVRFVSQWRSPPQYFCPYLGRFEVIMLVRVRHYHFRSGSKTYWYLLFKTDRCFKESVPAS
jgi:hypothetical protein